MSWKSAKCKHNVNKMGAFFRGYSRRDFSQPSLMESWSDTEASEDEEAMVIDETPAGDYIVNLTDAMMKSRQQQRFRKKKLAATSLKSAEETLWSANTASTCVKVHGKGAAIYEPQEEPLSEEDDRSDVNDDSVMTPVSLSCDWLVATLMCFTTQVKGSGLHQQSLVANFGEAYAEGRSQPRRFVVDLSRLIRRSTDGERSIGGKMQEKMHDVLLLFCPGGLVDGCGDSLHDASRYVR